MSNLLHDPEQARNDQLVGLVDGLLNLLNQIGAPDGDRSAVCIMCRRFRHGHVIAAKKVNFSDDLEEREIKELIL